MEFRTFMAEDEIRLAEMIRDTWGYNRLSANPEVALLMGKIYLYSCLCSQNFNQVAVHQNLPIGIIMGCTERGPKVQIAFYQQKLMKYYKEMTRYPEGKFILDMFSGFEKLDTEMLAQTGKSYNGELVFFVTDAAVRGHHVGTALYKKFLVECHKYQCKNVYVYTDATCNFGFYEHQGFVRVNQRMHQVHDHQFEFYVYEKDITE